MIRLTDKNIWSGRLDDEDGELGTRWHQVVEIMNFSQLKKSQNENIAFLGFCSDEGVKRNKGRVGAKDSPDIIRKALANLPYDLDVGKSIFDFGNIHLDDQNLEKARETQIESVSELLRNDYFPIVLGGGHETALGDFLAMDSQFEHIGIVNIDAHFDIRIPVENSTSGTPFFEMYHHMAQKGKTFDYLAIGIQPTGNTAALFKRAEDMGIQTVLADEVHIDLNYAIRKLEDFIAHHDAIYLSVDLDVIDAAFAPGVSAPTVNGLTPFQVKSLLQKLIKSNKVKLFDIVELNANFDQDNRTAKLAAHLIWEFL